MKPAGGAADIRAAAAPCSSRVTDRLPRALADGIAIAEPTPTMKKLAQSSGKAISVSAPI